MDRDIGVTWRLTLSTDNVGAIVLIRNTLLGLNRDNFSEEFNRSKLFVCVQLGNFRHHLRVGPTNNSGNVEHWKELVMFVMR